MKTKDKKGFTLMEIVIAIAILSVLSIYILKLFIATDRINMKSQDLDQAILLVKNTVTLLEHLDEPNIGLEYQGLFESRKLKFNESNFFYFDENFKSLNSLEKAVFLLELQLKKDLDHSTLFFKKYMYDAQFSIKRLIPYPQEREDGDLEILKIHRKLLLKF